MFGMCNSETGVYPSAGSHSSSPYVPDLPYCSSTTTTISNAADNHSISPSQASAAAAASYSISNELRSESKFEQVTNSSSPSNIVSDNGLHYANLDGSGYPPYHSNHSLSQGGGGGGAAANYSQYTSGTASETPSDSSVQASPSFSSYLDTPSAVQYSSTGHYPSLYHQAKIRPHEYASYHVPKAASNVPTYKWMQVKRNVPKPGKIFES